MSSNTEMVKAINDAIGAHGAWKLRLRTAISHHSSDLDPDVVCKDDQCNFGRWLHGSGIDASTRQGKPYEVVTRLHADFHRCAATVLRRAVTQDNRDAATLLSGEFDQKSKVLIVALNKWKGELLAA